MQLSIKKISIQQIILIVGICLTIFFTTNHLINSDLIFHTDVARDFLVLSQILETKEPTLIGPRAGGIQGVFHGPLWYYVNLIPFYLAGGNPVLVGWFWWLIGVVAVGLFFISAKKMTKDLTVSLLTTFLFAILMLPKAAGAINTYFADLFSFLVFLSWFHWYKSLNSLFAIIGWFTLGILVQFQMAFAIPIALIWLPVFIWKTIKAKKPLQSLCFFAFLPPLSTFILFDLRHDWLQIRSAIRYLQADNSSLNFFNKLGQRISSAIFNGLNVTNFTRWIDLPIIGVFGWFGAKIKNKQVRIAIYIALYWYIGWWASTLLFSGTIQGYYFSPFLGILLLIFAFVASEYRQLKLLLFLIIVLTFLSSKSAFFYNKDRFNSSSWKLLSQIAKEGLSKNNRGYFLYSQNQLAYPLKYAFKYYEEKHPEIKANYFQKKSETVLVKAADDPNNPYSTAEDWQKNKIYINQKPETTKRYPYGYTLEIYSLDQKAIDKDIDPNVVTDLHFR